ncbi:hypothetical protein SDC9_138274 [bioreactor metagenome]|uniref:Uncharacterized protein n=1 Tax=bioreactor metagenome TaxID=1076179 RepID=A0A645DPU9_9ZZZZ
MCWKLIGRLRYRVLNRKVKPRAQAKARLFGGPGVWLEGGQGNYGR